MFVAHLLSVADRCVIAVQQAVVAAIMRWKNATTAVAVQIARIAVAKDLAEAVGRAALAKENAAAIKVHARRWLLLIT